jgi:chloramphenicol-sensitive protein RarD
LQIKFILFLQIFYRTADKGNRMKKGVLLAAGAYGLWGLVPLYWKLLKDVPAPQLLSHRIVWSFVTLLIIVLAMSKWKAFRREAISMPKLRIYLLAAILIGINWLTYVWAVNAGHIVEASLGYFINPLLSMLFGVVFFRERLRLWQWIPVGLATIGVLYLTVALGSLPWISLTLATSFAIYGVVKKIAPLGSLFGLMLETCILVIPATLFLYFADRAGHGAFLRTGAVTDLLLIGAGIITTFPLLMFASAAQKIPLSLIGILQFISPTLTFLTGVLIYGEQFSHVQMIGYGIVWSALIIFGFESFSSWRARSVSTAEME